jgi:hypothetical protein
LECGDLSPLSEGPKALAFPVCGKGSMETGHDVQRLVAAGAKSGYKSPHSKKSRPDSIPNLGAVTA